MSTATGQIQSGTDAEKSIFVSPETAGELLCIARSSVFQLLKAGELASIRHGKRRLISRASVEAWAQQRLREEGQEVM